MAASIIAVLLSCYAASCSFLNVDASFNRRVQIRLKTVYLHDQRFPSLPEEQLALSFRYALDAIRDEFQATNVSFTDIDTIEIEDYFRRIVGNRQSPFLSLALFGREPDPQLSEAQKEILGYYPIEELRAAVPKSASDLILDYESYYRWLLGEWIRKRDSFKSFTVNGQPIVQRNTVAYQTHTGWRLMFSLQKAYDVFITNVPVFFDSLDIPIPHGVLIPRLVQSGFANESAGAPGGAGVALMVSTITFLNVPGLVYEDVSPELVPKTLGIYLLAHELGHMLFLLPEHYDHPVHCLMNTPPANWDRATAVKSFQSHKGPCPKCKEGLSKGKRWWLNFWDYFL